MQRPNVSLAVECVAAYTHEVARGGITEAVTDIAAHRAQNRAQVCRGAVPRIHIFALSRFGGLVGLHSHHGSSRTTITSQAQHLARTARSQAHLKHCLKPTEALHVFLNLCCLAL